MMLIIVALITLALATLIKAVSLIYQHVKRLERRIRTLEHLAGLDPPLHPNCRSAAPTFWGRDLSKHPLRAKRP